MTPQSPAARTEASRALADRDSNPCMPIYERDGHTLCGAPSSARTALDRAFANLEWDKVGSTDWLPVFMAMIDLIPALTLVSVDHDPNTADWHWAPIRCLLAGAGFSNWEPLARRLTDLYPMCPFDPTVDQRTWEEEARTAHQMRGWPVTLAQIPYIELRWALGAEEDPPERWLIVAALLHVLKHTRWSPRLRKMVVYHRCVTAIIPAGHGSNIIGQSKSARNLLSESLSVGNADYMPYGAFAAAVAKLSVTSLLRARPLTDMPGMVLRGPWSIPSPDPTATGFFQTGLRLDGVWIAENGRVTPYTGTQADVLEWDWCVDSAAEYAGDLERFRHILPSTYEAGWPSDQFVNAFDNMVDVTPELKVLLDLPIFSQLLRHTRLFDREYMMVNFLPENPTWDESTNQGKTLAAHTYGRIMSPAIRVVRVSDSSSAPDQRAIAAELQLNGHLVLDEWFQPRTPAHVLSHGNLQSLLTGGVVAVGKVLENSGSLSLAGPMIASAKALDLPPDMISRSLFFRLAILTPDQLVRLDRVQDLISGKASLQMRLGAYGHLPQIEAKLAETALVKVPGLRFDQHARLAVVLHQLRYGSTPEQASAALAQCLKDMTMALARHTDVAETSGVVAGLEDGGRTKLSLQSLFYGLPGPDTDEVLNYLNHLKAMPRRAVGQWNTPAEILMGVASVRRMAPMQLAQALGTARGRPSHRAIVQALSHDIRTRYPEGEEIEIPDTDISIYRAPPMGNYVRVRLDRRSYELVQ